MRLVPDPTATVASITFWNAFLLTLMLSVETIKGHGEPVERPIGYYEHHTKPWVEVQAKLAANTESAPTVPVGTPSLSMLWVIVAEFSSLFSWWWSVRTDVGCDIGPYGRQNSRRREDRELGMCGGIGTRIIWPIQSC